MAFTPMILEQDDARFPQALRDCLGEQVPRALTILGDAKLLQVPAVALVCSRRCPGSIILNTYDLAQRWRAEGRAVIGGFHSPMEGEVLTILLRGRGPVIVCPARGLEGMRLKGEYPGPLEAGRLLFVSAFEASDRRATVQAAVYRNRVVAALAERVLVAYAAPESKTEALCREVLGWGKAVYTLRSEHSGALIALGAREEGT